MTEPLNAKIHSLASRRSERLSMTRVRGRNTGRLGNITSWYIPDHVAIVHWDTGRSSRVGIKNLEVLS